MKKVLLLAWACAWGMVSQAETFYWAASPNKGVWGEWGELANWKIGGPDGIAATRLPGANDSIYYPQTNLWADLGGEVRELGTYDQDATPRSDPETMAVSNGTLVIKKGYESYYGVNEVFKDGKFVIASTVPYIYEAYNNASHIQWYIHDGGEMEIFSQEIRYFQSYYDVEAGGILNVSPAKFRWGNNFPWPNYYRNWGTMIVTNGCDFTGDTKKPDHTATTNYKKPFRPRDGWVSYLAFDQLAGTMRLGGSFNNAGLGGVGYFFSVGGGTLDVVRDTSFNGFVCTVSNDAQVAVNVAAGVTIDMRSFTYGTGSVLTKSGEGTLLLGENQPDALTVSQGRLAMVTTPDISKISFTAGTTIVFAAPDIELDGLTGYSDLHFGLDMTRVPSGTKFFETADSAMLAYVKSEVQTAIGSAYDVVQDGTGLLYLAHSDNVFDMTSGRALDESEGWSGGRVPTGEDVVLRGAGKVTLGVASPAFRSITLELNAELETTGGTEASPVTLPTLVLNSQGTVRVAGASYAVMTNGISASATAEFLPVFEVATNGIVFTKDPAWPNRGIFFKNLDFRLYGQLRVPDATATGGSQMTFGCADTGETAYFAFTADGGSIYAHHAAAAYSGNQSLVSIACPAAGGRVKMVRDVVFRDYRKIQDLATPDNPKGLIANSGYFFGVNNPADEVFDVVVDGCRISPAGPTKIAGGARLRFVNGAKFDRPQELESNTGYGHTRGMWIQDSGRMTFEGGMFYLDHPCGSSSLGKGLTVNPTVADTVALVLGGGVGFTLWEQYGNGRGVCTVTDGTFYVPRLHAPRMERNSATGVWSFMSTWTQTNTPAFNGFASVNVPAGGRLNFDASDQLNIANCGERYTKGTPEEDNPYYNANNSGNAPWYTDFWQWDRTVALAVPVTGAGDIVVTNSLAGNDQRNGAWYFNPSRNDFPDLSTWSMNLVLRGAGHTCSGTISAVTNVNAFLHLANGAAWAGTLRANSHVKFGDPIAECEGAAVAPVSASVGAIDFDGPLALRLWKDGDAKSNDFLEIGGNSAGAARKVGLCGVGMAGYEPQPGEYFTVARCSKTATPPKAVSGWKVVTAEDPDDADKLLVKLARCPAGTQVILK